MTTASSEVNTLYDDRASNTFDLGALKFWAKGNRILIQEDAFKTGYECTTCDGATKVACEGCSGSGQSPTVRGARCTSCEGSKTMTCPACNGKGGLIIAPEVAQRRPTTGMIVSVGPDCKDSAVGDAVMYSNFAGYVIDLERAGKPIAIRILHETEVLCGMEGHLELRSHRGTTQIAEFGG